MIRLKNSERDTLLGLCALTRDLLRDVGPCDHPVGICICGEKSLLHAALVALRDPAALLEEARQAANEALGYDRA